MSVACLLITDGRPCLQETLASAEEFLFPYLDGPTVLVSDTRHKLGLSGAIKRGWEKLPPCDYVFHLEDDWTFGDRIPVAAMIDLLESKKLAQVALKRQAIYHELGAGDLYRAYEAEQRYIDRGTWVESMFGFTFNPCIYRMSDAKRWLWRMTDGEAGITAAIREKDPETRFGMFDTYDAEPWCWHANTERAAGWKL